MRRHAVPRWPLRLLAAWCAGTSTLSAAPVHLVAIDGAKVRGEWMGLRDGTCLVQSEGMLKSFDLNDLMLLDFAAPRSLNTDPRDAADSAASDASVVVHLADGGRLAGVLLPAEGEQVSIHTTLLGDRTLSYGQLAAVRVATPEAFPAARELFEEALSTPLPGQDVMITRAVDDVKALRGRLVRLGPEGGAFVFGDRERTFQRHRLYGVVFAAGVARHEPALLRVTLSDGSLFSAHPVRGDAETVTLRLADGREADVPVAALTCIDVRSPRLVYLSDLTPTAQKSEGRLHRPTPPRRDRAVAGGPITLQGVTYSRGLAMTSRTEVTYDLGGAYSAFAATVGIDDAVRPYGAVNLVLLGNGNVLLDTGTLTGLDNPRDLAIPLDGVRSLTLITDYADGVDLADHADWALARLLRKDEHAVPSSDTTPHAEP